MLKLYRRHRADCSHRSRHYVKCACPIWVQGVLDGRAVRRSLDLTNWEAAQRRVRDLEIHGEALSVSVKEATEKFLSDARDRRLSRAIIRKYQYVCAELVDRFGNQSVRAISVDDIRKMRMAWEYAPSTELKRLEYVRTFFSFCMSSGWITLNPAKQVKPPQVKMRVTQPFSEKEEEDVLSAVDDFREFYPQTPERIVLELRALVLLMRYSGLRISDSVALKRDRIADGKLSIYAIKNQKPVTLPLPAKVLEALGLCSAGEYFFHHGEGKLSTCITRWQGRLNKVGKIAGLTDRGFAHRLRATFSVELLNKGVPLEMVAMILGNSARIVEKHYASLSQSRLDSIEEAVRQTW